MRRKVLFTAVLLMTVLMAALTASCDLPQGPGTGTLTLFLASGEGPAFARSATGRDFPEDALGTIAYELTLRGPSGETLVRTLIGGGPHSLTLTLGAWQVEVRALIGEVPIGTGSSALHLTGGDNRARLSMTLNQGVALARDEAELANEITAVAAGGSGVILLTGDIDLNSFIDIDNGKTITLLAAGPARTLRRISGGIRTSPGLLHSGGVLTLGSAGERGKLVFDGLGVPSLDSILDVDTGGTLIIDGNTEITRGVRSVNGGGAILAGPLSVLEMRSGKITDCRAQDGGAIDVQGGSFIMRGGEISGNTARSGVIGQGGAIRIWGGSDDDSFTMEGGLISGNTANLGGAVAIQEGGSFTMNGGLISGNTADGGGGVLLLSNSLSPVGNNTFTMRGGEISGNTALFVGGGFGGGVFVDNPAPYDTNRFFMEGGLIQNNTAANGGGVTVVGSNTGNTFTMTGGLIGANTATVSGGGVYVNTTSNIGITGPTFAKRGGTIAGDNTAPAGPAAYGDTVPPKVRSAEAGPGVRLYCSGNTTVIDPLDSFDTGPNWN